MPASHSLSLPAPFLRSPGLAAALAAAWHRLRAARAAPRLARAAATRPTTVPTGWSALDEALPSKGWTAGEVIELCSPHPGWAEVPLLLPLLDHLAGTSRPVAILGLPARSPLPEAVASAAWCFLCSASAQALHAHAAADPSRLPAPLTGADWLAASEAVEGWLAVQPQGAWVLLWAREAPRAAIRRLRRLARRTGAGVCVVRPSLARWDELHSLARLALVAAGPHGAQVQVRIDNRPLGRTLQLAWQVDVPCAPSPSLTARAASGDGARPGARVRQDPQDHRRAVVSGRMDEVCQALDRLVRDAERATQPAAGTGVAAATRRCV